MLHAYQRLNAGDPRNSQALSGPPGREISLLIGLGYEYV